MVVVAWHGVLAVEQSPVQGSLGGAHGQLAAQGWLVICQPTPGRQIQLQPAVQPGPCVVVVEVVVVTPVQH